MFSLRAACLSLLIILPLTAAAEPAQIIAVNFPSKAFKAHYEGQVQSNSYDAYRFHGEAGKVLNATLSEHNGSNIHLLVRSLNEQKANLPLSPSNQVLPTTGLYEIRVSQARDNTHTSAQATPYKLNIVLTAPVVEVTDIVIDPIKPATVAPTINQ